MTPEQLATLLIGIQIIVLVPLLVIFRLGGIPEGIWRLLHIKYFVFFILDPDNTPIRHVKKFVYMQVKSPEHFNYGNRIFYTDKQNMTRSKGRPSWYYTPNNSIPIPMVTGTQDSKVFDPMTIWRFANIDIERRILSLRKQPSRASSIVKIALAIIAVIIIIGLSGLLFG